LQPFEVRKRNPPGPVALLTLKSLNIIDKHRTVHIVRDRAAEMGWRAVREFGLPMDYFPPVGEIKDGAKLAEWTSLVPEGEVDVEFPISFFIAFGDTDPRLSHLVGANVIPVCLASAKGVRWIIGRLGGDTVTPDPFRE
jgi:hypothetical protein